MGKTLHDRVRLKGRYALFNVGRLHVVALCVSAVVALLVVGVQVLY